MGTQHEPECFKAQVEMEGVCRAVLVYHGVPEEQLAVVLQSSFNLTDREVVGLQDPGNDVFFPLSFVSRAPAYFAARPPYRLVSESRDVSAAAWAAENEEGADEPTATVTGFSRTSAGDADAGHIPSATTSFAAVAGRDTLSLPELQRLTGLQEHDISTLFEAFAACADSQGVISRPAFNGCLRALIHAHGGRRLSSEEEKTELLALLDALFAVFDTDDDGAISLDELASGLGVLCGGDADEKLYGVFQLYDADGDGAIKKEEMIVCLTSTFKVLLAINPEKRAAGVAAEDLAIATAEQAFVDIDDGHGGLNFDEFKRCFEGPVSGQAVPQSSGESQQKRCDSASAAFAAMSASAVEGGFEGGAHGSARRLTRLDRFRASDLHAVLTAAADGAGYVSRTAFFACFDALADWADEADAAAGLASGAAAGGDVKAEQRKLRLLLGRIFDGMDRDDAGHASVLELSSGLSVLCGGSRDEKVRAAFDLFDGDGDGCCTMAEVASYLTNVFRVLYSTSPGYEESLGIDAASLADAVALQAVEDAGAGPEGKITFHDFSEWYHQRKRCDGPASAEASDVSPPPQRSIGPERPHHGLAESAEGMLKVRQLLRLEFFGVDDILETLSEASVGGLLGREAFLRCIEYIYRLGSSGSADETGYSEIRQQREALSCAGRIFDAFAGGKEGRAQFTAIASGMTVLCAATLDAKVSAAFLLHSSGDGLCSFEQLADYLAAVFRILSVVVGPKDSEDLALATARECYKEGGLLPSAKIGMAEFRRFVAQGFAGRGV